MLAGTGVMPGPVTTYIAPESTPCQTRIAESNPAHLVFQNNGPQPLAIRHGDLVLIEKGHGRGAKARLHELFDLGKDPTQTRDIAASEPQQVQSIASLLRKLRESGGRRPGWRATARNQP